MTFQNQKHFIHLSKWIGGVCLEDWGALERYLAAFLHVPQDRVLVLRVHFHGSNLSSNPSPFPLITLPKNIWPNGTYWLNSCKVHSIFVYNIFNTILLYTYISLKACFVSWNKDVDHLHAIAECVELIINVIIVIIY